MTSATALPRSRCVSAVTLLTLGGLLLVGCSALTLQKEVILPQQSDGLLVERVTGFGKPDQPPAPADRSADALQASLRRITVQYHRSIGFLLYDPVPLLTLDQARQFSELLARELPGLAPNQRIRFTFHDFRYRDDNVMDVYQDGPYMVYDFQLLVADEKLKMNSNDPPASQASVAELPGQHVKGSYPEATYKDPLPGTEFAKSVEMAQKLQTVAAGRADGSLTDEEAEHLRNFISAHPAIGSVDWQKYMDRRATLKRARAQGLMDASAYQAQIDKLEKDLAR